LSDFATDVMLLNSHVQKKAVQAYCTKMPSVSDLACNLHKASLHLMSLGPVVIRIAFTLTEELTLH